MYIKRKRGQSTVEYVLLMTAVVGTIIALVASKNGGFQSQLNSTLNASIAEMNTMGDALASSHQLAPTNAAGAAAPYSVSVIPGANQGG